MTPLLVSLMGQVMLRTNLKDIEGLSRLIDGLALNKVQATKLNRSASNAIRRVLAKTLREQKDIHGKPLKQRQKVAFLRSKGKIKRSNKMFTKTARLSVVGSDEHNAYLGFNKKMAKIVQVHNTGGIVKFRRWGGITVQQMPKREFFGWSDAMVKEVRDSIINTYSKLQGAH